MNDHSGASGRIQSGDVSVFYRRFGAAGATPLLFLHGSSYYDSYDWIEVARRLAIGREAVAFDARGSGESSWSSSKDYSHDAHVADVAAILDHMGWRKAVIVGHSRGGAYATLFASRHSDRVGGLVLIDHCPGRGVSGAAGPVTAQIVGTKAKVFPSAEAVLAATSRVKEAPPGSRAHQRLLMFAAPVDGGYILAKRDPDYQNPIPLIAGWTATIPPDVDVWQALRTVRAPILVIRAVRSKQFTPEKIEQLRQQFPQARLVEIDSGHDVPGEAPDTLVAAIETFLATAIDGR